MGILAQALQQVPTVAASDPLWIAFGKVWLVPLLAFIGVVITIRAHDNRLRNEQLERRAKDRQKELHQWYGEFGSACHTCIQIESERAHLKAEEEAIEGGFFDDWSDERVARALNELPDRWAQSWEKKKEALTALNDAYSRLLLLEDNHLRIAPLEVIHQEIINCRLGRDWTEFEDLAKAMQKKVRKFLRSTGDGLDTSYLSASSLAQKGVFAPRVVVVEAPEVTARPAQ